MSSGVQRTKNGAIKGTGAAINVRTVGFRPSVVDLFNSGGNCIAHWQSSMANASMQKVVDSGTGTTDISLVTTGGITPLADGFTIGTDTDLNVSGELIHWKASE